MQRIVLTYGLIGGSLLAVLMLGTLPFIDQIGFDRGAVVGFTAMALAFMMVYFGVRSYRDTVAKGSLTFLGALQVGALISAVITVCYVATWQVMYYGFMPDFWDRYLAHAIDKARQSGASEAALAKQAEDIRSFAASYQNPLVNIAFSVLEPLPVGLVFTLVTAGLLGRAKRATGTNI